MSVLLFYKDKKNGINQLQLYVFLHAAGKRIEKERKTEHQKYNGNKQTDKIIYRMQFF